MQKLKIVQCIDRKMPLNEICSSLGIKYAELLSELEAIVYSGTRLDISYYVEDIMDEDQIDDIYGYFSEADSDSLDEAIAEFGGDYSDDDIRLIRILYISENAN
jgi:ATP-dependent DNA helicase RecQ